MSHQSTLFNCKYVRKQNWCNPFSFTLDPKNRDKWKCGGEPIVIYFRVFVYKIKKIGLAKLDKSLNEVPSVQLQYKRNHNKTCCL